MTCLRAMQNATYAVIVVLRVDRGVGCYMRNLFTDEERLLIDMGFSRTAQPGAVIATRILDYGDYITTSGAALPLGILDDDQLDVWQRRFSAAARNDDHDPAPLIRACLELGASSNIYYEEPSARHRPRRERPPAMPGVSARAMRGVPKHEAKRPLPQRRCRCGSGKMFKNCCGKR
jgi:hypothetical protein